MFQEIYNASDFMKDLILNNVNVFIPKINFLMQFYCFLFLLYFES